MFVFTGERRRLHRGHQQRQQQEPGSRLLESLPGPALRRVLQLASTPSSPALCRLCCVSKGLRAAAEAAHEPVWLALQPRDCSLLRVYDSPAATAARAKVAAHLAGAKAWMWHHRRLVREFVVDYTSSPYLYDTVPLEGSHLGALVPGLELEAPAVGQRSTIQPGFNWTLECLDVRTQSMRQHVVGAITSFMRLQVLVLRTKYWDDYLRAGAATQQLLEVLPQLRQLKKFALLVGCTTQSPPVDGLLHQLPAGVTAVDLSVGKVHQSTGVGITSSSSSLAHLEHLTSLRLRGVAMVQDMPVGQGPYLGTAALGELAGEQVQQQLARLSLEGQQQQQQQRPVRGACALTAMSLYLSSAHTWFAAPSLETLELIVGAGPHPDLALLVRCPRLRRLCVQYRGQLPPHTGVSAVTQVTDLRLSCDSVFTTSSGGSLAAELATLQQLQVLEVSYAILEAPSTQAWLPVVRQVNQLAVLVRRSDFGDQQVLSDLPAVLKEALDGTSSSSSTPSDTSSAGTSSSSLGGRVAPPIPNSSSSSSVQAGLLNPHSSSNSSGGGAGQVAQVRLRSVQFMLHGHSTDASWGDFQAAMAASMLQWEAALPGLCVTCVKDSYTCPCWKADRQACCG
jgi:hypothetical protein